MQTNYAKNRQAILKKEKGGQKPTLNEKKYLIEVA